MAKVRDYHKLALDIIDVVGGQKNIVNATRCATSRIFQRGLSICNCNSWTWNKAVREDGKYFSS